LTGRNAGIPGIAVSQAVHDFGVEGQAWGEVIAGLHWDTAATIAAEIVEVMLASPRSPSGVLNLNVPDLPIEEIKGWRWSRVGTMPPRSMASADLIPKAGHVGSYQVKYRFGESGDVQEGTDTAAIKDHQVSLSWLSPIVAEEPNSPEITAALDRLF
jgi:5'-nucleotidase